MNPHRNRFYVAGSELRQGHRNIACAAVNKEVIQFLGALGTISCKPNGERIRAEDVSEQGNRVALFFHTFWLEPQDRVLFSPK